ncbi:Protein CsiD [Escherichia coli]|nr:Protein CsiD [Escherichia coli]
MNALTAVQNNAVDSGQDYSGFTFIPSAQSPRLLELTFTETDDQTVSRTGCRMARTGAGVQILSAFSGRQNS